MIKFFKKIDEWACDYFDLTDNVERVCFALAVVDVAVFVISFAIFLVSQLI